MPSDRTVKALWQTSIGQRLSHTLQNERLIAMEHTDRITVETSIDGYSDIRLRDGCAINDAVCRLAEYENTGLSPDEIRECVMQHGVSQT